MHYKGKPLFVKKWRLTRDSRWSNKMTTQKKSCIFILSIPLLVILFLFIWLEWDARQYKAFIEAEKRNEPLFDALNLSVYKELPIPEGAQVIDQYSTSRPAHGRTLKTQYQISSMTIESLAIFYNQFFLLNGWNLSDGGRNSVDKELGASYSYYKGTACIYFFTSRDGYKPIRYYINIYYDYFAQSFSINPANYPAIRTKNGLPPGLHEFGETSYLRCPVSKNDPIGSRRMPTEFWAP